MADSFLTIDEVSAELQLTKEQVMALVKKGEIRAFLDQGVHKFRRSDIEECRKKLEGGRTAVYGGPSAGDVSGESKHDTSKVDLADIDAAPGADESDQTSVLAPAGEGEAEGVKEETPTFEFTEEDLGLSLEEQPTGAVEAADQTSLLVPAGEAEGEKEETPAFEFEEKEETPAPGAEGAESVLVADESESSLDILEITDDISSESETSAPDVVLAEESSSEDVATVTEVEESSEEPVAALAGAESGDTVVDILGETEEGTDDALETIDLEEVVETQETLLEEPVVAVEEAPGAETVEVAPLAAEPETVGVATEDSTRIAVGEEEVSTLAELPEEALEAGVEAEELREGAPVVAAGWTIVVPSKLGNAFLFAAIVVLALGGFILLCEMAGISNAVTEEIVRLVKEYFPTT